MENKNFKIIGFLILSSIIDSYLTLTYSKGTDDILVRESSEPIVLLLKQGIPAWLAVAIPKTIFIILAILAYLIFIPWKFPNPTYRKSVVMAFDIVIISASISNILGGLTWVVDPKIQSILQFIFRYYLLFVILIIGIALLNLNKNYLNKILKLG